MHFRHGSWPEELAIWRTALAAGGAQVDACAATDPALTVLLM